MLVPFVWCVVEVEEDLIEIQELVWTCSQKKLNASKTRNKIPPRPTGMMLMMICHGRIYIVYLSGHVTLISAKNVVTFLQKMSWPNQCFCFSIFIHSVNSVLVSQDGTTCMHNWGGLCKYWSTEDVSSGHRLWTLLFRGKRPTDIRWLIAWMLVGWLLARNSEDVSAASVFPWHVQRRQQRLQRVNPCLLLPRILLHWGPNNLFIHCCHVTCQWHRVCVSWNVSNCTSVIPAVVGVCRLDQRAGWIYVKEVLGTGCTSPCTVELRGVQLESNNGRRWAVTWQQQSRRRSSRPVDKHCENFPRNTRSSPQRYRSCHERLLAGWSE